MNAIETLSKAWLDLVKSYKDLFFLEFKLARYSFIPFCFMSLLFVAALGAFWLMSLLVIIYFIYYATHNWFYALVIAQLISAVGMGLTFFILHHYFKQLKFNHLRQQLENLKTQGVSSE
jgi:uncharacterized membrane protein YqjE